jgi:uncharacterized protein YdiU (UPF0061 family)
MSIKSHVFNFNNSYAQLPEKFYRRVVPVRVKQPNLIAFNQQLAANLEMVNYENNNALVSIFSGNLLPDGADPIAMAYAGHQFGFFVPQLGDGRALLLGEVIDKDGIRQDIQLKGPGLTPFSRRGDGRAALGPVLREYLLSEAMHTLGVSTTRSLAVVTTGEQVQREFLLTGAILTRVARSHIRIGTFEYFRALGDENGIKILADYVIARLYPEIKESANPYFELLKAVINAQAKLIASWMQIGFIHGVMNTDNMNLSGETIDYGPCAFMDNYEAMKVFSSIDSQGRYAFSNQPYIGAWNLARFAETLLPLIHSEIKQAYLIAEELVNTFMSVFQKYWFEGMKKKLGLTTQKEADLLLIESLFKLMQSNQADFTLTFRYLSFAVVGEKRDELFEMFAEKEAFTSWFADWNNRLSEQPESLLDISLAMRKINPHYIPRNHHIEQAISAAEYGDFSVMEHMLAVLLNPFDEQKDSEIFARPPLDFERVTQTYCGT